MTLFLGNSQASEEAIFAGGCFWCMEKPFDEVPGVLSTTSGYIGGNKKNPTYEQVSAGGTGHYEAVKIVYDPKIISYPKLLAIFWKNIDPYDGVGQFCDKGESYLSAVFYRTEAEKAEALRTKEKLPKANLVKTRILAATEFYSAEDYHQDYYKKNPARYKYYRYRCGRDNRLKELQEGKL